MSDFSSHSGSRSRSRSPLSQCCGRFPGTRSRGASPVARVVEADVHAQPVAEVLEAVVQEASGATHSLPPFCSFMKCFESWTDKIKGLEGTERAKKRPDEFYDTGTLPKKVKPKMAAYRITDCSWKTVAQSFDRALLGSGKT